MGFGYAVYFTERAKNRVVRWDPDSGDVDIVAGEPKDGDRSQKLSDPYGLAFDKDGSLLIADKFAHRLCRLRNGRLENLQLRDVDGHRRRLPESPPAYDPSQLWCPTSLFAEKEGTLLCTFSSDNTVYRIHPNGRLELVLGIVMARRYSITAPREVVSQAEVMKVPLSSPTGVVKRSDGTLFLIERNQQLVREYHPARGLRCLFPIRLYGEWLRRADVPVRGRLEDYHPSFPASLALDLEEKLYLCEPLHRCVLRLDPATGEFQRVLKIEHKRPLADRGPLAVAFGADGTAWVADSSEGAIRAYRVKPKKAWEPAGTELRTIGGKPIAMPRGGMGLLTGA